MAKMIFVFGSNLAGRHGAGSALEAVQSHGAKMGEGCGRTGDAYAIPTKDQFLRTLPLKEIGIFVSMFLRYARRHPELQFEIVDVGCGLAGYKRHMIGPLFNGAPSNCRFLGTLEKHLNRNALMAED